MSRQPEPFRGKQASAGGAQRSVFALLQERAPAATPMTLPKWVLIGLSHAIEDEYAFQSRSGVALAAFQLEANFRAEERRWRMLAEQSELAAVLADFRAPCQMPARPLEVPLPEASPLANEWVVACDCLGWSVCLVGMELDQRGKGADSDRRYAALWTMESSTVRAAARVLLTAAEGWFPHLRATTPIRIIDIPPPEPVAPRALKELSVRFAEYVSGIRHGARHGFPPSNFERAWSAAGVHEPGHEPPDSD